MKSSLLEKKNMVPLGTNSFLFQKGDKTNLTVISPESVFIFLKRPVELSLLFLSQTPRAQMFSLR